MSVASIEAAAAREQRRRARRKARSRRQIVRAARRHVRRLGARPDHVGEPERVDRTGTWQVPVTVAGVDLYVRVRNGRPWHAVTPDSSAQINSAEDLLALLR